MAELFEVQKAAISKHLKNIFTSGELQGKNQLFPKWKQLRRTENGIRPTIIIWMPLLLSDTVLILKKQKGDHVPHLGKPSIRKSLSSKAM